MSGERVVGRDLLAEDAFALGGAGGEDDQLPCAHPFERLVEVWVSGREADRRVGVFGEAAELGGAVEQDLMHVARSARDAVVE